MCIICVRFDADRDLIDAKRMLAAARREPTNIDPKHLYDLVIKFETIEEENYWRAIAKQESSNEKK